MVKRKNRKQHSSDTETPSSSYDMEQIQRLGTQSLDILKKTGRFFSKEWIIVIFLIVIAVAFSINFRMYSAHLDVTNEWARNTVESSFKQQIEQEVRAQYPNLPAENVNAQVEQIWQQQYAENREFVDDQVAQAATYFKSRLQDENNNTYLLAIDPYYYLRLTKNKLNNGHPGEFLDEQGRPASRFQLAPTVSNINMRFHTWFQVLLFKVVSLFNPSLDSSDTQDVAGVVFYTPVIVIALAVIFMFLAAWQLSGNVGGFIAASLLGLHTSVLTRTPAGFSDTDAYNILFPVVIIFFMILALRSKSWKQLALFGALAGISQGLYSFAWNGWWYLFDFILAALVAYLIYRVIAAAMNNKIKTVVKDPHNKGIILFIILFIVLSGVLVSFFNSFDSFVLTPLQPVNFASIKDAAKPDLWPNVYTTVAELNPASIPRIIQEMGGPLLFAFALLGSSVFLWKKNKLNLSDYGFIGGSAAWLLLFSWLASKGLVPSLPLLSPTHTFLLALTVPTAVGLLLKIYHEEGDDHNIIFSILMIIWTVGTVFAATKGIRFTMLLVPPLVFGLGIIIGRLHGLFSRLLAKHLDFSVKWVGVILFLIACTILVQPITAASTVAKSEIPSMNDAWYDSLINIKENSQPDAIISSWWDFGHQFITIAQRGATADGGSQNTPQAHWLGRLLATDDEKESVGILRMLNCDANMAFTKIERVTNDTRKSIHILYDLLGISRSDAQSVLQNAGLSPEQQEDILASTHCQPPESFLITSEDMVGKAGVWAHFGLWDFDKASAWNAVQDMRRDAAIERITAVLNMSTNEATALYAKLKSFSQEEGNQWISPWPAYYTGVGNCPTTPIAACSNGVVLNRTNQMSILQTPQGQVPAHNNIFIENDGITTILQIEEQDQLDIVFWANATRSITAHPEISASIFTRLFFADGLGTTYFEKFSATQTVTGQRIIVWKVDWKKYLEDLS